MQREIHTVTAARCRRPLSGAGAVFGRVCGVALPNASPRRRH